MLSGYGLYSSYKKGSRKNILERIANIYVHLLVIYLIILPIACYTFPAKYPGTIVEFLMNIFSVRCSYNAEQWFILPYIVLLMMSKPLFVLIDRVNLIISVALILAVWLVYVFLLRILVLVQLGIV